jgi:glyoxylase-like metal-dependent hydrolase (beta-lactamase superfamily II)
MSGIQFGAYKIHAIQTGLFKLDGGAMFGVVPKNLWSKKIEADESNRILMGMRSLLIKSEATDRLYLIDTGIGTKFDSKFQQIYGVDFSKGSLETELNALNYDIGDITDVIFTHLHFDHCGGTSALNPETGNSELIFKNANLWVTRSHWNTATNPNQREKASFLKENIEPISRHPRLLLLDGSHVFEDDFYTTIVNGHTLGQQLPVLEDGNRKMVFAADLFPTYAHIPVPWVMGYDMFPIITMEERERILSQAVAENWYFFMEHDASNEVIQVQHDGRNYSFKESFNLLDLA